MPAETFCETMAASYINTSDLQLTDSRRQKALRFQEVYRQLIQAAGDKEEEILRSIASRSKVVNYAYRKTGDGLIWVIKETIQLKNRMKREEIQEGLERFIESQVLVPGKWKPIQPAEVAGRSMKAQYLRKIQEVLEMYQELI